MWTAAGQLAAWTLGDGTINRTWDPATLRATTLARGRQLGGTATG